MTIYVLLEKTLATGQTRVKGVYDRIDLAKLAMEDYMSLYVEQCSYKIEWKELNDGI